MATIIRQAYIDKIEKYLGKETIIVLVGQRRVGKSYMMKTVRDQKASNPDNNIIYIDKEKREFDSIRNYQDLNQYIDEHFVASKHNYILIDEIQDIHGKRIFETNDKFYFEDNGIRNALAGGTREGDIEKVIENIIYQHLRILAFR